MNSKLYSLKLLFFSAFLLGIFFCGSVICAQNDTTSIQLKQFSDSGLFKRLVKKAKKGDAHSQFVLGNIYYHGSDMVAQSFSKSSKWYRKAAEQGHPSAQYKLGKMHEKGGFAIKKDFSKAIEWYKKAAGHQHIRSLERLAYLYYNGIGVEQDMNLGKRYARQAHRIDRSFLMQ